METNGFGVWQRLGHIARAAGHMTFEALVIMGEGFGAVDPRKFGGTIALAGMTAEQRAQRLYTAPDYVPQAWVDEQRRFD